MWLVGGLRNLQRTRRQGRLYAVNMRADPHLIEFKLLSKEILFWQKLSATLINLAQLKSRPQLCICVQRKIFTFFASIIFMSINLFYPSIHTYTILSQKWMKKLFGWTSANRKTLPIIPWTDLKIDCRLRILYESKMYF